MPTMTVGLVERVLMMLPQAQRISASRYFGCMSAFITKGVKLSMVAVVDKREICGFLQARKARRMISALPPVRFELEIDASTPAKKQFLRERPLRTGPVVGRTVLPHGLLPIRAGPFCSSLPPVFPCPLPL